MSTYRPSEDPIRQAAHDRSEARAVAHERWDTRPFVSKCDAKQPDFIMNTDPTPASGAASETPRIDIEEMLSCFGNASQNYGASYGEREESELLYERVKSSKRSLLKAFTDALARAEKAEKEVNQLNGLLRSVGWGQGEIDSAATIEEENEGLRAQLSAAGSRIAELEVARVTANEELRRLAQQMAEQLGFILHDLTYRGSLRQEEQRYMNRVVEFLQSLPAPPSVPAPQSPALTEAQFENIKKGIRHDGQIICELRREVEFLEQYKARMEWLHAGGDKDASGCEWGIYRVKWSEQGQPLEVWQTNSDFSDLDRERGLSPAPPDPCASELAEALEHLDKAATKFTIGCNCQTASADDALHCELETARSALTRYRQRGSPANPPTATAKETL